LRPRARAVVAPEGYEQLRPCRSRFLQEHIRACISENLVRVRQALVAASGDFLVVVRVLPHPIFKREGDDIYSDLSISVSAAALGGKLKYLRCTER